MAADPDAKRANLYELADVICEAFCVAERYENDTYITEFAELDNPLHRGLFIAKLSNMECTPAAGFSPGVFGSVKDDAPDIAQLRSLRSRWFIWLLSATKKYEGGERAHPALCDGKGDPAKLLNIALMLANKSCDGAIPRFIMDAVIRKHSKALTPYYGIEMREFIVGAVNGYEVDGFDAGIGEHAGMFLFMLMDAAFDPLAKIRIQANDRAVVRDFTFRRTILMTAYAMQCKPIMRNCATEPVAREHTPPVADSANTTTKSPPMTPRDKSSTSVCWIC
jgi:hypothetical protein